MFEQHAPFLCIRNHETSYCEDDNYSCHFIGTSLRRILDNNCPFGVVCHAPLSTSHPCRRCFVSARHIVSDVNRDVSRCLRCRKATRTTFIPVARETLNSYSDSTQTLPQLLREVKPFRVLAVIRSHKGSHAIVELAENCYNLSWYSPYQHSGLDIMVNRVIRVLQVDKAQRMQWFFLSLASSCMCVCGFVPLRGLAKMLVRAGLPLVANGRISKSPFLNFDFARVLQTLCCRYCTP